VPYIILVLHPFGQIPVFLRLVFVYKPILGRVPPDEVFDRTPGVSSLERLHVTEQRLGLQLNTMLANVAREEVVREVKRSGYKRREENM